jgi:sterol carrier protein 2
MAKVLVVGVGMTPFLKPSQANPKYYELAALAVKRALRDARLEYSAIQQACVGYVYAESTAGQRALYEVGMTGIPVYNVNNNCSTGSTALILAKALIESGRAHCVLALGFDKMERGSLKTGAGDPTDAPLYPLIQKMSTLREITAAPFAPQLFGNAGLEHMERYGTTPEHFAKIAYKNHLHSVKNPYSQFNTEYSLAEIMASSKVSEPLTKLQCCPTSDGAAAAILCSEQFAREHGLLDQAVEVLGMSIKTDFSSTLADNSSIKLVGYDMSKAAAQEAFTEAHLTPQDVQVCELHDCFSANELITYEALGLCEEGKAGEFIDSGLNTYGGRVVVNPSGGLISKGHPLGATGLAQCTELCWQLRGMAGGRQVPGAKVALQHNIGLGGAAVVALYKKLNSNPGVSAGQSSEPSELLAWEAAPKL